MGDQSSCPPHTHTHTHTCSLRGKRPTQENIGVNIGGTSYRSPPAAVSAAVAASFCPEESCCRHHRNTPGSAEHTKPNTPRVKGGTLLDFTKRKRKTQKSGIEHFWCFRHIVILSRISSSKPETWRDALRTMKKERSHKWTTHHTGWKGTLKTK